MIHMVYVHLPAPFNGVVILVGDSSSDFLQCGPSFAKLWLVGPGPPPALLMSIKEPDILNRSGLGTGGVDGECQFLSFRHLHLLSRWRRPRDYRGLGGRLYYSHNPL